MLRLVFALFLTLTAASSGQESRTITLRTLCFQHVNNVKMLYLPGKEPGQLVEVPLFTEVFSLPVTATATGGKVSFLLTKEPPAQGKQAPALPPVAIPSAKEVLFLFLPNPGNKDVPYQVVAMGDDEASFPLGTTKAMNLTRANLRFDLGELSDAKGILVTPGKTTIIPPVRKVNHLNQFDAKVLYEVKPKEFAVFYNTRWRSVAGKRDIAIAYIDPRTKQPMVNLYEDAPPAEIPPP